MLEVLSDTATNSYADAEYEYEGEKLIVHELLIPYCHGIVKQMG